MKYVAFFLLSVPLLADSPVVQSYSMLNGMRHHFNYFDAAYAGGTGDPTVALSPLSGGKGYLTDGVKPQLNPFADALRPPQLITSASWSAGVQTITIGAHSYQIGDLAAIMQSDGVSYFDPELFVSAISATTISFSSLNDLSGSLVGDYLQAWGFEATQSPEWIGWAIDDEDNDPVDNPPPNDNFPQVVFKFARPVPVEMLQLYMANIAGYQIGIFDFAVVDFSNDGVNFSGAITRTSTAAERALQGSYWVPIILNQTTPFQYVRLHMHHQTGANNNFIFISKAQFYYPTVQRKTICAAGCDYTPTISGFFTSMTDAASAQDSSACSPYVLELHGTVTLTSGLNFPFKQCEEAIEIRSQNSNRFPGKRFDPADNYNGVIVAQGGGIMFDAVAATRKWAMRGLDMKTSAVVGPMATYPVTAATWASGLETITIGAHLSGGTYSVLGSGVNGFNFGNITLGSETETTVTFAQANNPNTGYTGGATASLLYNYGIASMVRWGNGFDIPSMPTGFDLIQCGIRGAGQGEMEKGLAIIGDNVRILDSIITGASFEGPDSNGLTGTAGSYMELRNSAVTGVTENIGFGGSASLAGLLPQFHYLIGNYFYKEPWINRTNGNGPPTKPCFAGNVYRDDAGYQDYLCSGSGLGTWGAAPFVSTAVGPFPLGISKNMTEWKTGLGVRMFGNWWGNIPAETAQSGQHIQLEVVSQPFQPSSLTCPTDIPQPCMNIPQSWTDIADVRMVDNRFDSGFAPVTIAYSYYQNTPYWIHRIGTTTFPVTGNGTLVVTNTGSFTFPQDFVTFPTSGGSSYSDVLIDGNTFGVFSVSGTQITLTPVPGYPQTVSAGPHTLIIPSNSPHHDITFANNLITNQSDERNYCTLFAPNNPVQQYCSIAAGCGQSCGTGGFLSTPSGDYNLRFEHDTEIVSRLTANSGFKLNAGEKFADDESASLIVRNNVFDAGVIAYQTAGGANTDGCGLEQILAPFGGKLQLFNNIVFRDPPTGQTWESFNTGAVAPACTVDGIWPTNHAGGFAWNTVLSTSTFKVTNATYQNWGTDGMDPGADVDTVNYMTAHSVDGAYNPSLDMAIRTMIPTAAGTQVGLEVHASALDSNACTWELSTSPSFSSPVAVSSQTRTGRDIVALWSNGTLSGGTTYYARMTCGGDKKAVMLNGEPAIAITAPGIAPPPIQPSMSSFGTVFSGTVR